MKETLKEFERNCEVNGKELMEETMEEQEKTYL